MNHFFSSFESYQNNNGKEDYIRGQNQNGHVVVKGTVNGRPIHYNNQRVFRKTPSHRSRQKTAKHSQRAGKKTRSKRGRKKLR